jgi:hypothetical protein
MTVITASPKGFQKLLQLQEESLKTLSTMKLLMEANTAEMLMDLKADQKQLDVTQELLVVERKAAEEAKDFYNQQKKLAEEQAKAISEVAKSTKTFKTFGDKFKDLQKAFTDTFTDGNFGANLMRAMNVGGIFDKKLAKREFGKSQEAMTGEKLRGKDLDKAFAQAQMATKALQATEKDIADLKKVLGRGQNVSDDALAKTEKGRALLDQRASQSQQLSKVDKTMGLFTGDQPSAGLPLTPSDKGETTKSTSTKALEAATSKEDKNEMLKVLGSQTDILQQIANNTAAMAGEQTSSAGGGEDAGGAGKGIFGSIGAGLKSLGMGFSGLGRGVGQGIRGLLIGVAQGLAALANPATLVGMAALTVSLMGIGKAMEYATPFMQALAPVLMKVADVIGNVFITAIKAIPDVIKSIGDVISGTIGAISQAIVNVIDAVVGSVERLGNIDGGNLLKVGAGLIAVSGGLAAFAAANVISGLGNLVTNLLSGGADNNPINQLIKLADSADGLMRAAEGMQAIANALQGLSKIDKDSMKAINDFPWLKATAFVAAGGGMLMTNGAKVYNASKENADTKAANDSMGGGSQTNVVNAPKINNSSTTNVIKPNIRNAESSQSRYLQTRY